MEAIPVSIVCKGAAYAGTYVVRDGAITVSSPYGTRTRPVLRAKIPWLARHVLREIVAHAKKWGRL
jgi:hypothetical protein